MRKLHRHITILSVFILIAFYGAKNCAAEEVYNPYPIIFVHGINSSNDMWIAMRDDMRQYFMNGVTNHGTEAFKYINHTSEWNFFPYCDYRNQTMTGLDDGNNGNIRIIAQNVLKKTIDSAIEKMEKYTPPVPKSDRKVIIVCHSMGGLVVRSLLHQFPSYKDKIHRVVFIDTPHLGSPYASALWLLNEVRLDAQSNPLYKDTMYRSYSAFSFPALTCADYIEYPLLYHEICNTQTNIDMLLTAVKSAGGPRPEGTAIRQLRLPGFSYYEADYKGFLSAVTIYKSYSGSETFLGQGNLDNPKDYKIIIGKNTSGMQTTLWSLDRILKFSNSFTFPTLSGETQSIDNAVVTGDGIVTMSSQEGIGGADYSVSGFHAGIADKSDCIKSVLAAIDDQPQIERIYAVPCDWNSSSWDSYYIVVKVKEYLLADVEIQSIALNDDYANIDLSGFSRSYAGPYKPYIKFGKDFLRERSDPNIRDKDNNIIPLKPGEFYVKAFFPCNGYGSPPVYAYDLTYKFNIVLKNPANRTKSETIFICRPKASCYWSDYCIDVPPYSEEGDLPASAAISRLDISSGSSSSVHVKACMCESGSSTPFLTLKEGNISLHYNGDFYEAGVEDYASWSGSNGRGGTAAQEHNYSVKINIYPYDIYAKPIEGDYKLDIPAVAFPYNGIIRADPTFIQTHRSYSRFARFDTLRRFEQYGYSLNPAYLDEVDKTVREKIDSAVSSIVDIEDSFGIEKEKIIARARSISQNPAYMSALSENKASPELIEQLKDNETPLKTMEIAQSIEQLTKDKEIRISAIIENINNFASAAITKEAFSSHPASCAWAE